MGAKRGGGSGAGKARWVLAKIAIAWVDHARCTKGGREHSGGLARRDSSHAPPRAQGRETGDEVATASGARARARDPAARPLARPHTRSITLNGYNIDVP